MVGTCGYTLSAALFRRFNHGDVGHEQLRGPRLLCPACKSSGETQQSKTLSQDYALDPDLLHQQATLLLQITALKLCTIAVVSSASSVRASSCPSVITPSEAISFRDQNIALQPITNTFHQAFPSFRSIVLFEYHNSRPYRYSLLSIKLQAQKSKSKAWQNE